MPTRRQERVNARLVQEISVAIRDLKDPRIGFVTVLSASVTPDLRDAKINVTIYGSPEEQTATLDALQHSSGYIRRTIQEAFEMRVMPRLEFMHDRSVENADKMSRLIAAARASDPHPTTEDAPAPDAAADPETPADSANDGAGDDE